MPIPDTARVTSRDEPETNGERDDESRDWRSSIESEVDDRAERKTKGEVAILVALANAESSFRRDYAGRFLIELIQNARDAWVKQSGADSTASLIIALTDPPSLVVGNVGEAITDDVLLYSIGLVGESTKDPRQSIGHKGVGIKAILGVSDRPEIYSRKHRRGPFEIQVGFNREAALAHVKEKTGTKKWTDWLRSLPGSASARGEERVPTLAFPFWLDAPDPAIGFAETIAPERMNTFIRLPFIGDAADAGAWIDRIEEGLAGLSDEMLLLLGSFTHVRIARPGGLEEIHRTSGRAVALDPGPSLNELSVSQVTVARHNAASIASTEWRLYQASLSGGAADDGASAGISIGVRIDSSGAVPRPIRAWRDRSEAAARYHLFFPTEIATHLPFLIHGYFEVDAARQHFAKDSGAHNTRRLEGLRALVKRLIEDLASEASGNRLDIADLASLFDLDEPDDPLAACLYRWVVEDLRSIGWVSALPVRDRPPFVRPADLVLGGPIASDDVIATALPAAFLVGSERRLPSPDLAEAGRSFLARIEPSVVISSDALIAALGASVDGDNPIWGIGGEQSGFAAIVALAILLTDREGSKKSLPSRLAEIKCRFIPVVAARNELRLVPPQPVGDDAERDALFVRVGEERSGQLAVPAALRMAFLPDQTISAQQANHDAIKALGIRPFDTNSILERLASVLDSIDTRVLPADVAADILRFVTGLLLMDSGSPYRLKLLDDVRGEFEPDQRAPAFWPMGKDAPERQRQRGLSRVPVPTAAGSWAPAGETVVSAEWGERLAAVDSRVSRARVRALQDLDAVARAARPNGAGQVCDPDRFVAIALDPEALGAFEETDAEPGAIGLRVAHALLLRLGAWEIVPLLGAHDYRPRSDADPFATHPDRLAWRDRAVRTGAAKFDRSGQPSDKEHVGWTVAEDYSLLWDPSEMGQGLGVALLHAEPVMRGLMRAGLLCPGCKGLHGSQWERRQGVESLLSYQLRRTPWLSTSLDGEPEFGIRPVAAWWEPTVPSGAGLRTSPLRYLPLATGLDADVARLLAISSLSGSPSGVRVLNELKRLKREYRDGVLRPNPTESASARQAFIALHRRLYGVLPVNDEARTQLEKLGVLAERNGSLVWVDPSAARFDDRSWSAFRGAFEDAIPFSILPPDANQARMAIGIPVFEIEPKRNTPEWELDKTDDVRPLVASALPRLLALLVFDPVGGGTPLRLDGEDFPTRARNAAALQVFQVASLSIHATERLSGENRDVGGNDDEDTYLDRELPGRPRLYHELKASDWLERLKPALGASLAQVVDSPSHEDAFARLLSGSEAAQDRLLRDRGITPDRLRSVRDRLRDLDLLIEELDRRWWDAIIEVLGAPAWDGDHARLADALERALVNHGAEPPVARTTTQTLLEVGAGPGARDAALDGRPAMEVLVAAGISLEQLHEALRSKGDAGLRVGVAERHLRAWRRAHDAEVIAAIVHVAKMQVNEAQHRLEQADVREGAAFDLNPPTEAWLGAIQALLQSVGISIALRDLDGPDPRQALADGAGLSVDVFDIRQRAIFDAVVRAKLEQTNAQAWRSALIPLVVALSADTTDHDADLRERARLVTEGAPRPDTPGDLAAWLPGAVPPRAASASAQLIKVLQTAGYTEQPNDDVILSAATTAGRAALLDRVRTLLERTPGRRVEELRSALRSLRRAEASRGAPILPTDTQLGPARESGVVRERKKGKRPIPIVGTPDGRRRERAGRSAELTALASIVNYLNEAAPNQRRNLIREMSKQFTDWYGGDAAIPIVQAGQEAEHAEPGDQLDDALARFIHVSEVSSAFGFDLLGLVFDRSRARPAFLEVKSTGRHGTNAVRQLHVTSNEWGEAKRTGSAYALLLVSHDASGSPASLEAIVDPHAVLAPKGPLTAETDQYLVCVPPARAEGAA